MSQVIVVGVDHFLQNLTSVCMTADGKNSEARQKTALKARLEELISRHRPQLIGEEEKPGAGSIGRELADAHRLKYCPLTMSWELREKAGVRTDYNNTRETLRAAYEIFEGFMFEQIQKNRGDATSVLIICGSYHMERLAKRFHMVRDEVWAESTCDAPWYKGRPMEDGKGLVGHDKDKPDF